MSGNPPTQIFLACKRLILLRSREPLQAFFSPRFHLSPLDQNPGKSSFCVFKSSFLSFQSSFYIFKSSFCHFSWVFSTKKQVFAFLDLPYWLQFLKKGNFSFHLPVCEGQTWLILLKNQVFAILKSSFWEKIEFFNFLANRVFAFLVKKKPAVNAAYQCFIMPCWAAFQNNSHWAMFSIFQKGLSGGAIEQGAVILVGKEEV